ncbi:MAG TPA: DoxX family protein [Bacteroidia bacterium]|jgi:putative oxidoreductase
MKSLFFSNGYAPRSVDAAMLLLRLVFGGLMAPHGYFKLMTFAEGKTDFINFMGMGPSASLTLTIFAELFCSLFLMFGLFTRLSLIPLLIATFVMVSVAHHGEIMGDGFQAFAYMVVYFVIFLLGPGKYSLDYYISKKYNKG